MGEIFERPLPKIGLAFTGERLTTEFGGQTEIEHLHRYLLARHLCRGRQVLDIAAGEGYGTALLAQVATSVVGVEVAADVVAHAAENYRRENLDFRVGDARAIPLGDASVDVVVSFETIEHFAAHDRFLGEIRRVLRPGGLLVISTPDRDNYSPADQPANPYHALELTRPEFSALLQARFAHVGMWWQRPMIGSTIMPGPELAAVPGSVCFERRGERHFESSGGYPRPLYLMALCSDAPLPAMPPSVYIDTTYVHTRDALTRDLRATDQQATTLRGALQQREEEVERLRQENAALTAAAGRMQEELTGMRTSKSWRITAPLRAAMAIMRGEGR